VVIIRSRLCTWTCYEILNWIVFFFSSEGVVGTLISIRSFKNTWLVADFRIFRFSVFRIIRYSISFFPFLFQIFFDYSHLILHNFSSIFPGSLIFPSKFYAFINISINISGTSRFYNTTTTLKIFFSFFFSFEFFHPDFSQSGFFQSMRGYGLFVF